MTTNSDLEEKIKVCQCFKIYKNIKNQSGTINLKTFSIVSISSSFA